MSYDVDWLEAHPTERWTTDEEEAKGLGIYVGPTP